MPNYSLTLEQLRELVHKNPYLVACHPHTSPELLRELADKYAKVDWKIGARDLESYPNPEYNPSVLKTITENPNTPIWLLIELGADYPQQMLNNLTFNALRQQDPNFIAKMPARTINSLLQLEKAPSWILAEISRNSQVRKNLVEESLAEKSNTSSGLLEDLAQDKDVEIRCSVARNSNTPVRCLENLAQDTDARVRRQVASVLNILNMSVSCLEMLAQDVDVKVRIALAGNENTPASCLEILAQDADVAVRRRVASKSNTPASWLEMLAQEIDVEVRCRVASNRNAPVRWLEIFAQDAEVSIRSSVAQNENLPISHLQMLAQDANVVVRRRVARRAKKPTRIYEMLLQDKDEEVRWQAEISEMSPGCFM